MGGYPSGQRGLTVDMPGDLKANRQKGNLALASAIRHFVAEGYTVSIPLTDATKYDLVVERDGVFQAVQCKYAGYGKRAGLYSVPLYVSGGNRSAGNRRFVCQTGDFDLLHVLCANGNVYLIPFHEVTGQITLNPGRKSKWSRWEKFLLSSAGETRSPAEESAGEHFPKSVKPQRAGNAEPSP